MAAAGSVIAGRALRDFGDGCIAVLLPVHLTAIGLGPAEIGLVATLALLGSAAMTIGIGMVGGRIAARRLLLMAAMLMAATGIGYAAAQSLALIMLIALIGTINPSAGNSSLFVPIEHAVLGATPAALRTRIFARYALAGTAAAAAGALAAGAPDWLVALGVAPHEAVRAMFLAYAGLGLAAALLYARMPRAEVAAAAHGPLGPSRRVVLRLAGLFGVDAFAGGLAVQALLVLFLIERHGLSLSEAGAFFFAAGLLSAASYPVAAWLADRIGLVNTMVWTHIPSNLALALAVSVDSTEAALALLLVRAALAQMDVPARSSYVMAVVTPAERIAAASFTAVPRSLASAVGPALAGAMIAAGWETLPFILSAALKTAYDLGLLAMFRAVPPIEEG